MTLATTNFPHRPDCSGCPACSEIAAALLKNPLAYNPVLLAALHGAQAPALRRLSTRPSKVTLRTHVHPATPKEAPMNRSRPSTGRMTAAEVSRYAPPSFDDIYKKGIAALQAEDERNDMRTLGSVRPQVRPIVVPDDPSAPPIDPYQRDAELLRRSGR